MKQSSMHRKAEGDAWTCAVELSSFLLRMLSTTEVKVVKAPPYLIPKGKGEISMVVKSAVREKPLSQDAVQLGRIW